MCKKIIAIILMITVLSLSAQVTVGDEQVLKINNIEIEMELVDYLLLEGYSEKEANNLISNLSEEQIQKVSKEIQEAKKGGELDGIEIILTIFVVSGIIFYAVLAYYGTPCINDNWL